MADVDKAREAFFQKVSTVLRESLAAAGIDADVQVEPVPGTRLHRLYVISSQFDDLLPTECQDLVWRIFDRHFSRADALRISMIWTVSPDIFTLMRAEQETAA